MRFIILTILACLAPSAFAGWDNGNAGDSYAAEFELTAKDVVQRLELASKNGSPIPHTAALRAALSTTTVHSKDRVFWNDIEVDAVNYPSLNLIEVGRIRWEMLRRPTETKTRMRLVLHEYLWIIGVDDTGFRISQGMIELLNIKNFNPNIWWKPVNPANLIVSTLKSAPQGCHLEAKKLDITKSVEHLTFETQGTCENYYRQVLVIKSTGLTPVSSNVRGEFHTYEIRVNSREGENYPEVGKFIYEPEWGRCLVPDEGACRVSGKVSAGGVDFVFWFLRE